MAKATLSFVCQNCGAAYNRWQGKCESCGEWNTLVEEDVNGTNSVPASIRSKRKGRLFALESLAGESRDAPRLPTGMEDAPVMSSSASVFHSPQDSHLPCQRL
jgi:DNA repair protein RadA/Sms